MKLLKTPYILVLAVLLSSCLDTQSQVPDAVQATFEKMYPGEKDPDWHKDSHGNYESHFKIDGIKYRADFNADITATAGGEFNMVVRDSEGTIVLDRSLFGASEPDSIDGVTSAGISGIWTVTITLTSFNGDGSFSLSEGD